MANQTERLTGSIDVYLLGLADGLQKAQRQLTQMALSVAPGEAGITYQIPRLEFELKMAFSMQEQADGEAKLHFTPPTPGPGGRGANTSSADAASVIRGTFVAIPVHGGKPPPLMRTTLRRADARTLEVTVWMFSAAGEKLSGVDVQFNVDRERSRELTPPPNASKPIGKYDAARVDDSSFDSPRPELSPETNFWDALVTTDSDGRAVGVLNVAASEPVGTCIAAIVDCLGQTQTILFRVEQ